MTSGATTRAVGLSTLVGLVYWGAVSWWLGGEPWDAAAYWTVVYPGALLLSAALGIAMPVQAWRWGALVVFAQVPVVIVVSGTGPLLLAGVLYAAVLSIPAALVSASAGWIRRRGRGVGRG